jgi:hypothetical protein
MHFNPVSAPSAILSSDKSHKSMHNNKNSQYTIIKTCEGSNITIHIQHIK